MNYLILGMSVSGLLELQGNANDYLKALNQLLHEYDYYSTHEPGSAAGKPKMVLPPVCYGPSELMNQRNFFKPVKGAPTRRSEGNTETFFAGENPATPQSNYTYLNILNLVLYPPRKNRWTEWVAIRAGFHSNV
jgi:hypothetical protein